MLLLAASIGSVLLESSAQLPKKDMLVWESAKNSVAVILRSGVPVSQAALIDKSGLFLANQSAIASPSVRAKLANGKIVTLDWKATDVPTQTVLLQAEDWAPEDGTVVTLHQPGDTAEKVRVLVVLPSGPILGDLIAGNRVGVLSSSRRAFQLGEVRFEANAQSVAGALVFDEKGQLLGLLNATLENSDSIKRVKVAGPNNGLASPLFSTQQGSGGGAAGGGRAGPRGAQEPAKSAENYGPADTTTGYTVGPEILRRVVSGFLSPTHKVLHPAIGIQVQGGLTPGALVIAVRAGSPADAAGIQVGDTIVKMDNTSIKSQMDFSLAIESKDVGDSLTIVVMRDFVPHTYKLTVGTIQKALATPESV